MSRTKVSGDHRTVRLVHGNVRFESFLADLSATFVDVPADQIDSQVTMGLQQIVKFLGVDRSGFGQLVPGENKFAITHSYQVPGVPPTPKVIVDDQFPVYARKIREGEPFRLPDDIELIEDAVAEREYLTQSGLKSQLTVPLKVAGAVVGGIGFASFRSRLEWPDDLVVRLRLIGEVFTHALARKQADESLQLAKQQVQTLRNELSRANQQLVTAVRQARERESQELVRREESSRIGQLLESLTPREREVFLLASAGLPNKIIAKRLGICLQTVKLHRGRLMQKLQLDSVAALARLAEKAGIPPPSPTGRE